MIRLLERLALVLGLMIVATLVALLAVTAVGALQGRDRGLNLAQQAIRSRDANVVQTAREVAAVDRQVAALDRQVKAIRSRDAKARRVLLRDIHALIRQVRSAHVKPVVKFRTVVRTVHEASRPTPAPRHHAKHAHTKPAPAPAPQPTCVAAVCLPSKPPPGKAHKPHGKGHPKR